MTTQEAKKIHIADYLQSLGYSPVKQQGKSLWYKSPFREEAEASFKVNTELNQWYDFGTGKGGNIIALAQELYGSDYVPYLLGKIAEQAPHVRPVSFSFRQQASEPSFQHLEVRELTHPALLRYLQERGINTALAQAECKELHFVHNGKPYFAIGFPNVAGGYEVRNRFFKGCIAPKDISHIRQSGEPREKCLVFEGMTDYLSFLTLRMKNCPTMPNLDGQDYVILNSVSNVCKAIDVLHGYERIHCLLDNDEAGRNAYWELAGEFAFGGAGAQARLLEAEGVELLMTGGHLRRQSQSFYGDQAEQSLQNYHFDMLFLGVDAIDLERGVSTHNEDEARLNRRMCEVAERIIVVTDSSKFNRSSLHKIIDTQRIDMIIVDEGIPADSLEGLRKAGVEVILVGE